MRVILLAVVGMFGSVGHALELQPYTANYLFNLNQQLTGTATRTLTKLDNSHYNYKFSASAAIASASEESNFLFNNQQVQSLSYQNTKQILFKIKTDKATFDWQKHLLTGERKGETATHALDDITTLDPLNLEIQIRHDLLSSPNLQLKAAYVLGDAKGVHPLSFTINGTEKIKTPYGELDTLKVSKVHKDNDRKTQFWLAKSLDYLPVKVVQTDDGAVYTVELQSFQKTAMPHNSVVPVSTSK